MDLINHLRRFRSLSQSNGYRADNITIIEGITYFYNIFDKKVYDVSDYKNEDAQIIYSVLERYINKKLQVKNFIRDDREDYGDDGGYSFYVGNYKDKFILGTNYINYNLDFSEDFKNINELEPDDEGLEYKLFDTLYEIDIFISKMFDKIEDLTEEYEGEDWGEETWDMDPGDFESEFMFMCIRNLGSAFSEDLEINKKKILRLTIDSYEARLYDPVELYSGYVEDNNIEAIELN